jgi:hypothetical protein
MSETTGWNPERIIRVVEAFPTGSSVVRVETEQGEGFLKALSNRTEPHNLVAELVGTRLARRMKLQTLEFAVIRLSTSDRIRLHDGRYAHAGSAFITRLEDGIPWGGSTEELNTLANPNDIGRLIVFDTWTRNCDRFRSGKNGQPRKNRDNVYFSRKNAPSGRFILKAIDHGCCFTCGGELTPKLAFLDAVQEDTLYGRFPEFGDQTNRTDLQQIIAEVERIERADIEATIGAVPSDWQLNLQVREALCSFLVQRAQYLRTIIDHEWP